MIYFIHLKTLLKHLKTNIKQMKKKIKILLIFQRNEIKMEMRIEIKNEMIKRNKK